MRQAIARRRRDIVRSQFTAEPCRERQCRVAVLLQKVERKPGSERGALLAPLQSAILPLRCDGVQPPVRRDCVLRRTEGPGAIRSEEHTSELQSLMRISYAVFCLQKNKQTTIHNK